ncbi:MAG: hypothetical protein LIO54_08435 [Oscillospiraceae bacterium]|nr:hypothetical protein [Oscillospiraceae bacterium]
MITWLASNWYLIIAFIAVAFVVGFAVYAFFKLPTSAQISALREWLKYAVTMAEKELGSGTGQLKLRFVYDLFIDKFAWLAKFISFEVFSDYVDEALVWLNGQLSSNKAVSELVSGTTTTTTATAAETATTESTN